jgi:hypothetical protein
LKTLEGQANDDIATIWSSDYGECLRASMNAEYAWGDVRNIELPIDQVRKARKEEMAHMAGNIFKVVNKREAWDITGKPPISAQWMARDFKDPNDKDSEDLFRATPPIEMMRFMLSRQVNLRRFRAEDRVLGHQEGTSCTAMRAGRIRGAPDGGECEGRRQRQAHLLVVRLPTRCSGMGGVLLGPVGAARVEEVKDRAAGFRASS